MKKMTWALLTAAALIGLGSCDLAGLLGSKDTGKANVIYSDWMLKGTFNSWADQKFIVDEVNTNLLTWEVKDLSATDYSFVIHHAGDAGDVYIKANDATVPTGEAVTLGIEDKDAGTFTHNIAFTAEKSSYVVQLDITNPESPVLTLVPGENPALAITEAQMGASILLKGSYFSTGWDGVTGTYDADSHSVTWEVPVVAQSGGFAFNVVADGTWLKTGDVVIPELTTEGQTSDPIALGTAGGDVTFTNVPKADSVYRFVVTIDLSKGNDEGRYSLVVGLKTLGTDWPTTFEPWSAAYIAGDLNGWSFAEISAVEGGFAYTFTAGGESAAFKVATAADWGTAKNFDNIEVGSESIALSSVGGGDKNIGFTTVKDHQYTILVSFGGSFSTTNKPVITVTDTTPAP